VPPAGEVVPPVEESGLPLEKLGTAALCAAMAIYYGRSWSEAQVLAKQEREASQAAPPTGKPPRIDALEGLRFLLIAYIASGHFIHTATSNKFLLRLITQINVVVGAFFVISGYVTAYTTTEIGQRKGKARLDNAVEFIVQRVMGHWPLHLFVLLIFSPMFIWVDASYSGMPTATSNGIISVFMLQAWFPMSAEAWNAPTWFLSAFSFAICVLPYCLRVLAGQSKEQLRRSLIFLTVLSLIPKLGYSYDLNAWGIMEGMLNARSHPNYALFNSLRFSPFAAVAEVLMGAVACRLVMLDDPKDAGKTASPVTPLLAMLLVMLLRAMEIIELNDMLIRSAVFIPLWIVFLMRIHRQSIGPAGPKGGFLPKVLCQQPFPFLGSLAFPIFIVHGPIGQVFYKKAVAKAIFGTSLASPSPNGLHWFFGVYWATVLVASYLLTNCFLKSKAVADASKSMTSRIIRLCSDGK